MNWKLAGKAVGLVFGGATVVCSAFFGLVYCVVRVGNWLDKIHEGLGVLAVVFGVILCVLSVGAAGMYQILKKNEQAS